MTYQSGMRRTFRPGGGMVKHTGGAKAGEETRCREIQKRVPETPKTL